MEDVTTIELGERLTIADVHDRYHEWQDAISGSGAIAIDAGDITAVDTAGLQLLLAVRTTVLNQSREFTWQAVSGDLKNVAALIDMTDLMGLDNV